MEQTSDVWHTRQILVHIEAFNLDKLYRCGGTEIQRGALKPIYRFIHQNIKTTGLHE